MDGSIKTRQRDIDLSQHIKSISHPEHRAPCLLLGVPTMPLFERREKLDLFFERILKRSGTRQRSLSSDF